MNTKVPDYYHFLGLCCHEEDLELIKTAIRQRTLYIRKTFSEEQPEACEELLKQLAEAEFVLLNPNQKSAYDADLRARQIDTKTPESNTAGQSPMQPASEGDKKIVVSSSQSPRRFSSRRAAQGNHTGRLLFMILFGGVVGIAAGIAILWFVFDRDPLGAVAWLQEPSEDKASPSQSTPEESAGEKRSSRNSGPTKRTTRRSNPMLSEEPRQPESQRTRTRHVSNRRSSGNPNQTTSGFNYPDFSATESLVLFGDAFHHGSAIRLTPAQRSKVGQLFHSERHPIEFGFRTKFEFQITEILGPGADGISFMVQKGEPGGPHIPFFQVFLDTFRNPPDDPNANYLWVRLKSPTEDTKLARGTMPINASDGKVHAVEAHYDGIKKRLTITFDNVSPPFIDVAADLTSLQLEQGKAWVGFTSSTGACPEAHDILSWSFESTPKPLAADEQPAEDRDNLFAGGPVFPPSQNPTSLGTGEKHLVMLAESAARLGDLETAFRLAEELSTQETFKAPNFKTHLLEIAPKKAKTPQVPSSDDRTAPPEPIVPITYRTPLGQSQPVKRIKPILLDFDKRLFTHVIEGESLPDNDDLLIEVLGLDDFDGAWKMEPENGKATFSKEVKIILQDWEGAEIRLKLNGSPGKPQVYMAAYYQLNNRWHPMTTKHVTETRTRLAKTSANYKARLASSKSALSSLSSELDTISSRTPKDRMEAHAMAVRSTFLKSNIKKHRTAINRFQNTLPGMEVTSKQLAALADLGNRLHKKAHIRFRVSTKTDEAEHDLVRTEYSEEQQ